MQSEIASATVWHRGDFHVIGAAATTVSEALCDDVDLCAGQRVLDVACGSGNTALAAARRGCSVSALDIVEGLIERGRRRSEVEGFSIDFRVGDAHQLPFEDASFDVVLSSFGVMFAPDQERAAAELLRVCRPGGTIGLANWTLESLAGAMFALTSKYVGPPRNATHPPIRWGTVPGLRALFGNLEIRLFDRTFRQRAVNFDAWLQWMRMYFGPLQAAFAQLDASAAAQLEAGLRELVPRYNRATDGTLSVCMSYIEAIVRKPA